MGTDTGLYLLNVGIQATLAAAIALLLARLIRTRSAPARYGVFLACLTLVLATPGITWLASKTELGYIRLEKESGGNLLERRLPPTPPSKNFYGNAIGSPRADDISEKSLERGARGEDLSSRKVVSPFSIITANWPALLGGVWGVGVLVGIGVLVYGCFLTRKLRASLRATTDDRIPAALARAVKLLGLQKPPSVLASELIPTPLSFGIFRPTIVFPKVLEHAIEAEEVEAIILHEAAHVAHRDHIVGLFQRLAGAAFWWNPLVRKLNNKLSEVREEVCDNYVVRAHGDGKRFAKCLLDVARRTTAFHRLPATVGLVHPRSGFEARVEGLLKKERNTMTKMNLAAVVLAVTFAVCVGAAMIGCNVLGADAEKPAPNKPEPAAEKAVSWGEAVNHLQIGLSVAKADLKAGEQPEFTVHIKNLSKADKLSLYDGGWIGIRGTVSWSMRAVDTNGERYVPRTRPHACLGCENITIDAGAVVSNALNVAEFWQRESDRKQFDTLPPGKYTVTMTYEFADHNRGDPNAKSPHWLGEITTGAVKIDVLAGLAAERGETGQMVLKQYDVSDIVKEIESFPMVVDDSGPQQPKDAVKEWRVSPKELVNRVRGLVPEADWKDVSLELEKKQLTVRQTEAIHRKVEKLLAQLREELKLQVRIETYFIQGPKAELEAIIGKKLDKEAPAAGKLPDALGLLSEEQFQDMLKKVKESKHTNLLSAPRITTFNGQKGSISIGSQQLYTAAYADDGTPHVKTVWEGITLEALPRVSGDRKSITLELRPVVSELLGMDEEKTERGLIKKPKVRQIECETKVSLPNGSAVFVGLIERREAEPAPAAGKPKVMAIVVRATIISSLPEEQPKAENK